MKNYLFPILLIVFAVLIFFSPFLVKNRLPVSSDTIVGLYHPFRDLYSVNYPRGIPFKNFLITDPVRQQFPWRNLVIEKLRNFELPLWNPYNFAGTPLLANLQSAAFYPFNIIFLITPFNYAWSLNVMLQPLMGGIFLYFYLKNLKINNLASLLSSITFSFSGFNIAWLEWNTVVHTGLWLPLILLSIDKIFANSTAVGSISKIKNKKLVLWSIVYVFALMSSFFAGHLQTFFYLFMTQGLYLMVRWFQYGRSRKLFLLFTFHLSLFTIITSIQWVSTLQLINFSARSIDFDWRQPGWFLPWQNLVQFIIPDFFGNPTTLNYWGIWNYAEFIGYIGIFPLIMALYAISFRYDKKTLFFGSLFFLSLVFSLPTFIAKLPYIFNLPFISTSQPTRLLYMADFSLTVLAGLGLDYYMKVKNKIIYIIGLVCVGFILVWLFTLYAGQNIFKINPENIAITQRNSYLPLILFTTISILLVINRYLKKKMFQFLILCLIFITSLELFRFANKFTTFSSSEYLFPTTKSIEFINKNVGLSRIMSIDSRILPPNFSIMHRLYSIDGYDPLYLKNYGELIAASERGEPNIKAPFGFNRIITPKRYNSRIIDLLGVKYILSLSDIDSPSLIKVFQEGETRIYENSKAFPRVFFVKNINSVSSNQEAIEELFRQDVNLSETAVLVFSDNLSLPNSMWSIGDAEIVSYKENEVVIRTKNQGDGFLVFTDSYYPTWKANIDKNIKSKVYRVNYNFRGVIVPKGDHTVRYFVSY